MLTRSIRQPLQRAASAAAHVETPAALSAARRTIVATTSQTMTSSFSTTPAIRSDQRRRMPGWRRASLLEVQKRHPRHDKKPMSSAETLRKTPLYDLHVARGGKMVPFGGFSMPVHYSDLSHVESHHWTREKASVFDVSHMVQHSLKGPGAEDFLHKVTPAGLGGLANHHSTLGALLQPENGGIVDDCVITRIGPESFYFVTNAGCREKDLAFIGESLEAFKKETGKDVTWDVMEGQGLVALQGPLAQKCLEPLVADSKEDDLNKIYFGQSKYVKLKLPSGRESSPVLVSRGGYTGEDGFEISIPENETKDIVEFLLQTAGEDTLRLAGLGARDSLRLEAGMCLYGHDLDETTTPVEGALSWIIPKNRRTEGGFNGSEVILKQLVPKSKGGQGTERRRVGLTIEGAPAREGALIYDLDDEQIGKITSGSPSPTLGKNIAMGYVKMGHQKSDTQVVVVVRGKKRRAFVTKMPFVPSKYYKEQ